MIEKVFAPSNLDQDCRRISQSLVPVKNAIRQYFLDGEYEEAAGLFLQFVDTMCEHFVADEHWCWFDDFYLPGDDADECWEMLRAKLGQMSEDVFDCLEDGLIDLAESESYENYGVPNFGEWLAEMKAVHVK